MAGEIVDTDSDQDYRPTSEDKSQGSRNELVYQKDAPHQDGKTSSPELRKFHLLQRRDDGDSLQSQCSLFGDVIGIKRHVEIYRCRQDAENRAQLSRFTRT